MLSGEDLEDSVDMWTLGMGRGPYFEEDLFERDYVKRLDDLELLLLDGEHREDFYDSWSRENGGKLGKRHVLYTIGGGMGALAATHELLNGNWSLADAAAVPVELGSGYFLWDTAKNIGKEAYDRVLNPKQDLRTMGPDGLDDYRLVAVEPGFYQQVEQNGAEVSWDEVMAHSVEPYP